jgi:predicted Zn-dependent protease with MMP-like domain
MTDPTEQKKFARLARDAIAGLPESARRAMENVAFVLEETARGRRAREVGIRKDEVLLGLYEGVPKTKRGAGYFGVLPDKITLFRKPLEELACGDTDKLRRLIRDVVRHEVGHHLGFDEEGIRALERKHKKR